MSELPRFNTNSFDKDGSPTGSPPRTPTFLPKGLSIPKRLSLSLASEKDRKPSVASFHGDLVAEKKTKQRRKFWWKALTFVTLFIVGVAVGTAIGYWAIPHHSDSSAISTTSSTLSSTSDVVDSEDGVKAKKKGTTTSTTSSSIKTSSTSTSSTKASSTSASVKAAVASSSSSSSASSLATASAASSYWKPTSGSTFQIQLASPITSTNNLPSNIAIYETDLYDTPASTIAGLHAAGKKVICYFSAGTAEDWRTDYSQFTSSDIGAALGDWAGEYWLDTRSTNVRNIMAARIALAQSKGCDGVDPDNMDVYSYTDSGITGLTEATSINYMQFLATTAHNAGLAIGLKNAGEILTQVVPFTDWSISESCVQYNECNIYQPYVAAGKPAFNIQYPFGTSDSKSTTVTSSITKTYCTGKANVSGFSIVLKHYTLDAWMYAC